MLAIRMSEEQQREIRVIAAMVSPSIDVEFLPAVDDFDSRKGIRLSFDYQDAKTGFDFAVDRVAFYSHSYEALKKRTAMASLFLMSLER